MKKETKKERERRLNTRLDNPHEDLRRAIEKIEYTANIDDASSSSAVATTEDLLNNIVKKDIAYKKGLIVKQQNAAERNDYTLKRFKHYRESGMNKTDSRKEANIDRREKFGKKYMLKPRRLNEILKD